MESTSSEARATLGPGRKEDKRSSVMFLFTQVEKELLRPTSRGRRLKKQKARERRNRISKFNDNPARLLKTRSASHNGR